MGRNIKCNSVALMFFGFAVQRVALAIRICRGWSVCFITLDVYLLFICFRFGACVSKGAAIFFCGNYFGNQKHFVCTKQQVLTLHGALAAWDWADVFSVAFYPSKWTCWLDV